mmetsp:Transcript_7408/g.27109  ORF Transcript_7408/g.27109 Transcript_7408/m.27109 type:complete len:231 (+) Transcript_7408:139-831(+)
MHLLHRSHREELFVSAPPPIAASSPRPRRCRRRRSRCACSSGPLLGRHGLVVALPIVLVERVGELPAPSLARHLVQEHYRNDILLLFCRRTRLRAGPIRRSASSGARPRERELHAGAGLRVERQLRQRTQTPRPPQAHQRALACRALTVPVRAQPHAVAQRLQLIRRRTLNVALAAAAHRSPARCADHGAHRPGPRHRRGAFVELLEGLPGARRQPVVEVHRELEQLSIG